MIPSRTIKYNGSFKKKKEEWKVKKIERERNILEINKIKKRDKGMIKRNTG